MDIAEHNTDEVMAPYDSAIEELLEEIEQLKTQLSDEQAAHEVTRHERDMFEQTIWGDDW